ncbi:hypothetical protein G4B88_000852 [Cannabis sativa]|uniref:Uncharacterized protein n=1 Tax=Cannabis sativa TaxID=3483 RepID=A0A7J6DX79_CANSA|nr:hypothetical protein G4B88_000852 [Cannabis sativa]
MHLFLPNVKMLNFKDTNLFPLNINFPASSALVIPLSESATAVGAGAATPAELSGCVPMLEVFKLAVSTFKVNNWGLFGSV